MDQSAKLEEQSSLVLVVWDQNNGKREILCSKSDLKVLHLHLPMLSVQVPVLTCCLVYPLMLWGK